MAEASIGRKRYAVVTGANKGLGFEICRQLALQAGMRVVLTARDEKKGLEAVKRLKEESHGGINISDDDDDDAIIMFHQLDVTDSSSIASLVEFIKTRIGKLDILVNNAGSIGAITDTNECKAADGLCRPNADWSKIFEETYELAEECMKTNYYGVKQVTEMLLPLLQSSEFPKIVNISSMYGKIEYIPSEWARGILNDVENLTEERIDRVVNDFLKDFKEGSLHAKGWPNHLSSYIVSKASLNSYTRVLAKKYPRFRINCVCPGSVITDLTCHTGALTPEQGAQGPVWLAQQEEDGPSGSFFSGKNVTSFCDSKDYDPRSYVRH